MAIRMFDWGPSPFCLKVRAILDYKGLAYDRMNVLGPPMIELWRRGRIGKVPALDIDGQLVCDSTDIAYALEQRHPEPAVLPASARDRALCHAIEDWADESIYFVGLYCQWLDEAGARMVPRAFGRGLLGRASHLAYARLIRRQLRGQGTARKPAEHVRSDLERHIDAAHGLLDGRTFVLADAPLLCDFALAAQLIYLRRTPVGKPLVEARPAIVAFLDRMKSLRRDGRVAASSAAR
jgi:glutathione S-transferase